MMNGWSNGSNLVLNIIGSLVVLFSDVEKLFTEKKGFITFVDDYTWKVWAYSFRSKDEARKVFTQWIVEGE
mgnify:CR=1 FL=1